MENRVFRPQAAWAGVLTAAVLVAVVTAMVVRVVSPGLAAFVEDGRGVWKFHAAIAIAPLIWAGLESQRYFDMLRRRCRLGLADPVIVDRFRLWAIGMLLAASVTAVSIVLEIQGRTMVNVPIGGVAIGILGSLSAVAMGFAFVPPAAYTRWVAARPR